jgi:hypothetical protein
MSKIVEEVIAANKKYALNFGAKERLGTPAGARIRDTHLYGCET